MASAIIHICVAKKVNEYLKQNEKELFLGSIAPDISKQIGQSKIKSHFMSSKPNVPDIKLFMHKYKDKIKTPFDYGYLIHLYTDKLWYLNLEELSIDVLGKLAINSKEYKRDEADLSKIFYDDYTNMNIKLIDKFNLDLTLFYEEFEKPNTCVKEIPIKKLNILIDQMGIIIANSHNRRNRILEPSKVVDFINASSNEIIEFLQKNNL